MPTRAPTLRYDGPRPRLLALMEASRALATATDHDALLRRILDLSTRHVGAERGALFVMDRERGGLVATIFHGDELAELHVGPGRGLVGQVVATGKPIRIRDAYLDARFDRSVDAATGFRTRSVLVAPLLASDGSVLGALEVLNKQEADAFDADDEAFLGALAAQAAVALETARLVEERLREARLAGIGQVVATLVHDLRGPLSGLMGYAALLEQEPPPEVRGELLEGLRRQGRRMDQMVRSILRYVRGEERFLFAKTDIDELVKHAAADFAAAAHDHPVTVEAQSDDVGVARVDALALRRALDNLLRNAIEAMEGRAGRVELRAWCEGGDVLLRVSDQGKGLSEAARGRLFQAFATSGKREGTGLGLELVQRVVEGHAGRIEVESEPGRGTAITLRLPAEGPPET
ncbi:MAG: sensor histidine kinase [Planctomycetota bacterium]